MKRKELANKITSPEKRMKLMDGASPLKRGAFNSRDMQIVKLGGLSEKYAIDTENVRDDNGIVINLYGLRSVLAKKADMGSFLMEMMGGKIYRVVLNTLKIKYLSSSKLLQLTSDAGENWVGVALEEGFIDLYKHYIESNYSQGFDTPSLNRASAGYSYEFLPDHLKRTVTLVSLIRWLCADDDMHPGNIMVSGQNVLMIDAGRVGKLKYTSTADAFNALMWTFMFHQRTSFSKDVKGHFIEAAKMLLDNQEVLTKLVDNVLLYASPSNNHYTSAVDIKRLSLAINKLPQYPFTCSIESVSIASIGEFLSDTVRANFQHLRSIYSNMKLPSNLAIDRVDRLYNQSLIQVRNAGILNQAREKAMNACQDVCDLENSIPTHVL